MKISTSNFSMKYARLVLNPKKNYLAKVSYSQNSDIWEVNIALVQ